MKFQPDHLEGVNAITARTDRQLAVNGQVWTSSIILPWRGEVSAWACMGHDALTADDFAGLIALQPEVVLYGSGARQRFAEPALVRQLMESRIGFECMDTAAACRTYNVLVHEGRRVVAALLLG